MFQLRIRDKMKVDERCKLKNIIALSQEFWQLDFQMRIFFRIYCNNAPIYCVIQDVSSNLQRNDRDTVAPQSRFVPSSLHLCLDQNKLSCIASTNYSNFYHKSILN